MSPNVYFVPVSCRRAADIMREWVGGPAESVDGLGKQNLRDRRGRSVDASPVHAHEHWLFSAKLSFQHQQHLTRLPTPPAWHVGAAFDGEEGLGSPFIPPANWPREKSQQGYVLLSNSAPEQHTVTIGLKGEPPRCARNCMLANC